MAAFNPLPDPAILHGRPLVRRDRPMALRDPRRHYRTSIRYGVSACLHQLLHPSSPGNILITTNVVRSSVHEFSLMSIYENKRCKQSCERYMLVTALPVQLSRPSASKKEGALARLSVFDVTEGGSMP